MKTYAVRSNNPGNEIRILDESDRNRFMQSASWEVIAEGEDLPPVPSRATFDRSSAKFKHDVREWTCAWQGGSFRW